jgi:hypothetical protein
MSYKPAKWTKQNFLGPSFPKTLKDAAQNLSKGAGKLTEFISSMEEISASIEKFLQTYLDPIAPFMKGFTKILDTITKDIFSVGGAAIIITPWNRINKRYITFFPSLSRKKILPPDETALSTDDADNSMITTTPSIDLPAMTPAEAFSELRSSFSNTKDPYRPRWTANVKTSGSGFLIVGGLQNPEAMIRAIYALAAWFDFPEFKKMLNSYTKAMESYIKDLEESPDHIVAASTLKNKGTFTLIKSPFSFAKQKSKSIRKKDYFDKFILAEDLPELHWYGLSVENIPYLKLMTDSIFMLLEWVNKSLEKTTSAVWELFYALKNRIFSLVYLVSNILSALESIYNTLSLTDVYSFSIEPEFGGVDHIIQSLQKSINSPANEDANDIAKAWVTSQQTILFFMGAGGEINTKAWEQMFENLLPTDPDTDDNYYTLIGISDGAIYPLKKVFSIQFASEEPDLKFAFRVKNSSGKSLFKKEDYVNAPVLANTVAGEFVLKAEDKYTLEVDVYNKSNKKLISDVYNFELSSLISDEIASPQNPPLSLSISDVGTTVTLLNSAGGIVETLIVFDPFNPILIGQTINKGGVFRLVIVGSDGRRVETFVELNGTYAAVSLDTLQTTIYSPAVPVFVKFSKNVADIMKVYINEQWQETSCPGYLLFYEYFIPYPIRYYKERAWNSATITILPFDSNFKDIC